MDIFNYEWAVDALDLTFDGYNPRAPGVGVCRAAGSPGLGLTSPVWRVREFGLLQPPTVSGVDKGIRDIRQAASCCPAARGRI